MRPDCKPDDPSIKNTDLLLRRIHPKNINPGTGRILPDAFRDPQCSVDLKSKSSPERCLAYMFVNKIDYVGFDEKKHYEKRFKKGWRVASILTEVPRGLRQTVYFDPTEVKFKDKTIVNGAHCIICGEKDDEVLYELAQKAEVVLLG